MLQAKRWGGGFDSRVAAGGGAAHLRRLDGAHPLAEAPHLRGRVGRGGRTGSEYAGPRGDAALLVARSRRITHCQLGRMAQAD